ncbi:hypothetical protein B0H14DRAFT_3895019 [Mycena olivaceomarginata]|nr:hypothetical protein B0H14DRAFT_3895019 [Mycena olivaceomarginata]
MLKIYMVPASTLGWQIFRVIGIHLDTKLLPFPTTTNGTQASIRTTPTFRVLPPQHLRHLAIHPHFRLLLDLNPFFPPVASATPSNSAVPIPAINPAKDESVQPSSAPHTRTSAHDHTEASVSDYPTGYVRRECIAGEEGRKWNHNKWVFRSSGTVQHEGNTAEMRLCLGVFRCSGCGRLTRPKTQTAARNQQQKKGCTERTCRIDTYLIHDTCDARTFQYKINRYGQLILVWEHYGDHSAHARPPGDTLSKAQEDQVDIQVMRKHDANAHELRTGDPGPGSIPLPTIAPTLAAPSSARYQVAQSQVRLGINTGSSKGGLAVMSSFADLVKRLSTPFIIDSSLSGPVYMTFQTPFMDTVLREAVESWILDLAEGPEASRHGFVTDGDHTFFRHGPLLASCAFNSATREWIPILYSWINGQDKAHHRPHFAHIFQSIIKHAGNRFSRQLLLCVMDFSGAQRGAHAEAYADAIISTMPHFSLLSQEAQDAERHQLVLEAEKGELGCHVHFWRSADQSAGTFEKSLRELLSPMTTSARFDEVVSMLKSTFPAIKHWLSWWERRPIASMIFPAKSSVDPALAAKAPSTTNPVEHQHSLLHHAVGKDQELIPGIEKLFLHVREMENKYNAIKEGHFNAGNARNRRPQKAPVYAENDGRAPDTVAALAAAAAAEANAVPALPVPAPHLDLATQYSPRLLQSFRWDSPNSCFVDTPLELWFRAFALWSATERVDFLKSLPSHSALAKFFYIFQRRLLWIESSSSDFASNYDFSLCQSQARLMIFDRWKLYKSRDMYGNATSWLHHAIETIRSIDEVISAHAESSSIFSNFPPASPALTIVNTPRNIANPADLPDVDSAVPAVSSGTGIEPAPFPFNETPPRDLPNPMAWCYGCRKSTTGGDEAVLHCADCGSVHHLKCAMEVNPDLDLEAEWYCNVCFTPKPVAWSDDLLGKYLMCQTNPCSSFYPARVAGITSAGMVRMEWYPDNVYDKMEQNAETEFLCSREECATVAAKDPTVCYGYDKSNVGTIKWPPRLQEDAAQLYCYDNPEISAALTQSRQRIIDIILANDTAVHPIISDYHEWMLDAPQSKETRHADDFSRKFSSIRLLPGDASLIDVHTTHVLEAVTTNVPESSEVFRQRAVNFASILFQLVVLRLYLRRPAQDDVRIYFLARKFTPKELQSVDEGDPLGRAKHGKVVRHLTVPEAVLQTPEDSSEEEPMPPRFVKWGLFCGRLLPPAFLLGFGLPPHMTIKDSSLSGIFLLLPIQPT